MTQAKAQAVVSAIIGNGFNAAAFLRSDGEWVVRAKADGFTVNPQAVVNLAANQSVTSRVAEAEFV